MTTKFRIADLPHRELVSAATGEKYSLSSVMTDLAGFKDIFVHHEIIPPGRKSSATHYHTKREEMVVVMTGKVVAWMNGAETTLLPGEFMAFPPGSAHAHHVRNDESTEAKVLIIASNPPQDETKFL